MKSSDHSRRVPEAIEPSTIEPPVIDIDDDEPTDFVEDELLDEDDSELEPAEAPPTEVTRDPIATAPRDGRDVLAFWGEADVTGRAVRWKQGRYFTGRKWAQGGSWIPSDSPAPLPAAEPTEWLHFWGEEGAVAA